MKQLFIEVFECVIMECARVYVFHQWEGEREREREGDRGRERKKERGMLIRLFTRPYQATGRVVVFGSCSPKSCEPGHTQR